MHYRTTPPPERGDLTDWACYEAAAWPVTTPQGESYTWWVRFVERVRGKRPAMVSTPAQPRPVVLAQTMMEF